MAGADNTHIEFSFAWAGSSTYASTLESTGTNAQLLTWYFVEFAWNQATPYREIFVNGVSKGSSSSAMSAFENNFRRLNIKEYSGVAADFYIGRVIVSADSSRDLYAIDTLNYPG